MSFNYTVHAVFSVITTLSPGLVVVHRVFPILCCEGRPSDADGYDRGGTGTSGYYGEQSTGGAIYTPIDTNVAANAILNRQRMEKFRSDDGVGQRK